MFIYVATMMVVLFKFLLDYGEYKEYTALKYMSPRTLSLRLILLSDRWKFTIRKFIYVYVTPLLLLHFCTDFDDYFLLEKEYFSSGLI